MVEIRGGIQYQELLRRVKLKPGDEVKLMIYSDKGARQGIIKTKVVQVFRHHVLLDFGKYKESRRIADIALGLAEI